jgi:phosphate:Na+ symporter
MGLFFGVMAGVMLFIHGLAAFSEEITRLGGDRLRRVLRRLTSGDLASAVTGALSSALLQSSSAVSAMTVGLCHSGALTNRGAVGVLVGANVGTTLTAWLVAFKVTGLGPVFVTLGGLWSLLGPKAWRTYGKPVFYFGLIFLALDEVASHLRPLAHSEAVAGYKALVDNAGVALAFGVLLTVLVQSSSVVSGLVVIAVGSGLMDVSLAAWVVVGANLGTTSTALMASAGMDEAARRLALLNAAFNLLGLLLFVVAIWPLVPWITGWVETPGEQVAMIHTVFNLSAAAVALLCLPRLWPRLESYLAGNGRGAA